MSEFIKRGAVSQAVSGGPMSPRVSRNNKPDTAFAYWFAQGKSILSAFIDAFTRSNNTTSIGNDIVEWITQSGTWGIDSNQAATSTAAASYPVATFDAGTIAARVKATLPETRSAGAGLAFWVTDNDNWWAAVADKVDFSGAPYNCPSGGSITSGSNCQYTYGAQGGGPYTAGGPYSYWACNSGTNFGNGCWYYSGSGWVQFGTGYIAYGYQPPYTQPAPYNYTPTTVNYTGTATNYNRSDFKIIKKTAGTVSTVSTHTVATPSATTYLNYIQAETSADGVTITATDSGSPNTVTSVNVAAGTPVPASKFGVIYAPATSYANPKVEQIEYTPL